MGMLMAMTMMEQEEAARKAAETATEPVPDEEIPFAEPEEPVEKPEAKKQPVRRTTATRRRKTAK